MSDERDRDDGLDAFFDAARRHPETPDAQFTARLLDDALAAQPPAPPLASAALPRTGWLAALGGWPALGGLVTATVAGLWIGVSDPATVGDIAFGTGIDGYDFSGFAADFELGLGDG